MVKTAQAKLGRFGVSIVAKYSTSVRWSIALEIWTTICLDYQGKFHTKYLFRKSKDYVYGVNGSTKYLN